IDPPTPQTIDYSWALLGEGGASAFENRLKVAVQHARDLLSGQTPLAKLWLQDLHYAERIIVAATPALIEKTVVTVAMENGASWVGVSNDMDRVWRISDGSTDYAGFEDGHERGDMNVSDALADRYAKQPNPVDGRTQDYPDWWDKRTGKS